MNDYGDPEPAPAAELPLRRRHPRGRFRLTPSGTEALREYRATVATAQGTTGGRQALEECQAAWASARALGPRDALVLEEISSRPQTVVELLRSLDTCGMPRPAIESGIDRLASTGLIELASTPPR